MLIVGKTLKPHGVKGEIKVKSFMDSPENFKAIKYLIIDNENFAVENVKIGGDFVILKLKDINDRDFAEKYCNFEIKIKKEDAPKLSEGRYYIVDLLGCEVFLEGEFLGILKDIYQYGSADVYSINGQKNVMFPLVNNVINNINIVEKKIFLNNEEFQKVAVYED